MSEKPDVETYALGDLSEHFDARSGTKQRIAHEQKISKSRKARDARPKNKTSNITIRISPRDKQQIQALAKRMGTSVSEMFLKLAKEQAKNVGMEWKD
ncbi:MAG: hypothetical protein RIC14_01230 [Filomicrobium sp.]